MDRILKYDGKMYPEIMTIKQVAEYLQVDEKTIYRLAQKGEIPCFKIGYTWRFKERIDKWIEDKDVMNNKESTVPQLGLFEGEKSNDKRK